MKKTNYKKSTIISSVVERPKASKNRHYVDNAEFFRHMKEWRAACNKAKKEGKERPRIPEPVGAAILKVANGLSMKINFITKKYREEMVSDAIENCIMYAHRFNPRKSSNPFSYFTQICYYAFLRRISKENKQTYVKYKMMIDSATLGSSAEAEVETNESAVHAIDNIELDQKHMEGFVVDYETKHFGTVAGRGAIGRKKRKAPKKDSDNLDGLI